MLNLLLSRLMPALRPEAALAQFELDVSAPLSKQMDQVLAAVADGRLTIDNAQDIAKILQTRAEIAALEGGGDQAAALVEAFKQLSQVLPR